MKPAGQVPEITSVIKPDGIDPPELAHPPGSYFAWEAFQQRGWPFTGDMLWLIAVFPW